MFTYIASDRDNGQIISNDVVCNIAPDKKILHGDTFNIVEHQIEIISSNFLLIPGILRPNNVIGKENDKDLCLFIPDNPLLRTMYVPYKNKQTRNFCKIYSNRFVTVKRTLNPYRVFIDQNIGEVSDLNAFCEYKIHCKKLAKSLNAFNKKVRDIIPIYFHCHNEGIITIDSSTTRDYDDAIGFTNDTLSVYIADVPAFMEQHQLWNDIEKVSSIYLPDGVKRPMLPPLLSENLLSLCAGTIRQVFCMHVNVNTYEITFNTKVIQVEKNCVYDTEELFNHPTYINCLYHAKRLIKHFPYRTTIDNSYDLVEYLMLFMNASCAKTLKENGVGIYRSVKIQNRVEDNSELGKFLSYWKNATSSYTTTAEEHMLLKIPDYVHITSPIRRLVDILNMYQMQKIIGIEFTEMGQHFYNTWFEQIDLINNTVKDIRNVQNECAIMYYYWDKGEGEENVDAYVIENEHPKYVIYIPSSKYITKLHSEQILTLYDKISIKIYFFNDKSTLNKKIRVIYTKN